MQTVSVAQSGKCNTPVSAVTRSWQRCVFDFGIEPHTLRQTQVLTRTELRDRQQRWGALMNVALRELENLYELIAGTGYVAALADADGTVLSTMTDPSLRDTFRNSGLCPGAVWDERTEGTNGIGTCLAERKAIVVHHEEHFRDYNTCLSCSGAPIVDIDGRVIGALDASSVNRGGTSALERHTMALVSMSARIISRWQFLTQCPDHWILRFHSRPEFVGLLQEALLAVDAGGRIVAANDSAVLQLGNTREQLVGRAIDTLFAFDLESLHERATVNPSSIWPVRGVSRGRRFFALVRPPAHAQTNGRPVPVARGGTPFTGDTSCAIAADAKMRRNLACGHQLFAKQVPILLHGETGTGKDVFAHTLHDHSPWSDKAFVVVNCAAIPENLIESELFGYRAGAFTGAAKEGRTGRLLQSSGGTLFLDEIGDMPLLLQARLLRAIEAREITPVGSDQPVAVDLHLISASHHDLREMIAAQQFREDLYYRLAGMTLELPPLRERQDKTDLIHAILAEESNGVPIRISPPALDKLLAYHWPGNIRQLRNTLRTAAALCRNGLIKVPNLPQEVVEGGTSRARPGTASSTDDPLRDAERSALIRALNEHGDNVSRTAQALGLSRNTLYRKMRKHAIQHLLPAP
ncbi:MAG: sigma-54-dependent Fis family transcriptional regulator [Nevskiaceae bacterium]|nr:MAG: sigma-54-dependent Fis family transcriptional regulator [Nevskiaceae bacterium]TBR73423.1 MAG: sigma-54-dependent Fis family transcriptional regulator [Nevskiaceae bacterium]